MLAKHYRNLIDDLLQPLDPDMDMKTRDSILLLLGCFLLGPLADFFINGIVIGLLFRMRFTEQLAFVYVPFLFAVAMILSKKIVRSRFAALHPLILALFFFGALLGHLTLVGLQHTRKYSMSLDNEYDAGKKAFLLRSPEWSQILFVTSEKAQAELRATYTHKPVPVEVAVVSNYGCDRSVVVSTVAGVDVRDDNGATWTWQVDRSTQTSAEASSPGNEDQKLFWCYHPPRTKEFENPPARAWETHPAHQATPN
jgi:hypothetical protein